MKDVLFKILKKTKERKGFSWKAVIIILTIIIVLAVVAGVLTWYFRKDVIELEKTEMYINDRDRVQEALFETMLKVQEKYNVTVVINQQSNISSGIVYELKGLNNSAVTGGKIGWKTKATNATVTQDTSFILGFEMPNYNEKSVIWSTDIKGNIILKVNEKVFEAPQGTDLNSSLKTKLSSFGNGTNNIEEARNKKIPYVPNGFKHLTGTTVANGYVIYDNQNNANEYVWIPVSNMNNWPETVEEYYSKEKDDYIAVRRSVETYGGFYIGRYEASNDNLRATSRIDQKPWTNISWSDKEDELVGGAAYYARKVANDFGYVDFKSTLVYESQWKDILNFIDKENEVDSSMYGNYMDATFNISRMSAMYAEVQKDSTLGEYVKLTANIKKPKNTSKTKTGRGVWLTTTGTSSQNSIKNIYDIAGNVAEWTMSTTSKENRNVAGGSYIDLGIENPVNKIVPKKLTEKSNNVGFRVALYL